MSPTLRITLSPPADWDTVAADWRALEAESDVSFFQSWTWVGCRAAARYPAPLLLRAQRGGRVVGLALLNRRGRTLWLGESGNAAADSVYVEYNGPLLARDAQDALAPCLRALLGRRRNVRLSGADDAHLAAARTVGAVRARASPAPCVELTALRAGFLASLSANTRQQLRRSDRAYAALGPPSVRRAETLDEALTFLDALATLHQATWTARSRPGAFANPAFTAFHRELLARALPRGEAELLRIAAGATVVGYLYNFRHRGHILAYQSGFAYPDAPAHGKPGLTCHHGAIALAMQDGMQVYDFLAGADRYKTSFANASTQLHWIELARHWSVRGMVIKARGFAPGPQQRRSLCNPNTRSGQ